MNEPMFGATSRRLMAALALFPSLAVASVGRISTLEGNATRTPKAGAAEPLKAGSEVDAGDVLEVGAGNLKLTLSDGSVLMLGAQSKLELREAQFENLERKSFSAKLWFGKIWAKVTKVLSGSAAKFEVNTERAVAGVRGTIFRVDTAKLFHSLRPKQAHTVVKVTEGKVAVEAKVKPSKGAAGGKVERHPVPGPSEVSKEDWEKRFVELQSRQQIEIGDELWKEAAYDPGSDKDDFGRFVKKNE